MESALPPVGHHHGQFGFGNFTFGKQRLAYFAGGIERAIASRGHPLIISRVHPTAGIATRARQLKETILRQLDILGSQERIIVIAHSMGGMDARYMISCLGMEDRVSTLVTISTPHHGSSYADWCVRHLGQRLGGASLMNFMGLDVQAISDLTIENCAAFNERVIDSPKVRYFSISASRPWHRVPPFMLHSWRTIFDAEGPNDSLVAAKSAIWGTHLGTWPADHFHQINKRFVIELKDPTGDITPYYVKLLETISQPIK
jgi:triacylglycerol lipase